MKKIKSSNIKGGIVILTYKLRNKTINCYDGTHNKEQFKSKYGVLLLQVAYNIKFGITPSEVISNFKEMGLHY